MRELTYTRQKDGAVQALGRMWRAEPTLEQTIQEGCEKILEDLTELGLPGELFDYKIVPGKIKPHAEIFTYRWCLDHDCNLNGQCDEILRRGGSVLNRAPDWYDTKTLEEIQGKNEFHAKKQFSVCCRDVDIPEFKLRAFTPVAEEYLRRISE